MFRQLKTLGTFIVFLMSTPVSFGASLWDHNGSVVRLEASGQRRMFYYESPRPSLPVEPGVLLFQGSRSGNTYEGTAYHFSAKCGTIAYQVRGSVSGDQTTVELYGRPPVRNSACVVTGHSDETLVFTYKPEVDEPTQGVRGSGKNEGNVSATVAP